MKDDLKEVRKLIVTASEMAQDVEAREAKEKAKSHFHIYQKGRVAGLKEALIYIDGYRELKNAKNRKSLGNAKKP